MSGWIEANRNMGSNRAVLAFCLLPCGCASPLNRQAQQSTGLLDFIGRIASRPSENVVPVERCSGHTVEIVSASAIAERGGTTYVSGVLERGFEAIGDDNGHINVKVLGPKRQIVAAAAVDYFSKPITATYQSVMGRAYFGIRLPIVLTPQSTVQVGFHQDGLIRQPAKAGYCLQI